MSFHSPKSLQEAFDLLSTGGCQILAGGTDFFPGGGAKHGHGDILDLSRIAGLRGISRDSDGWCFGAMTTWSDIARAALSPEFAGLQQVARAVGSVQIQNLGTLAGNICNASPAADGVPALLTLNARVGLGSAAGNREVPISEFITGPRATVLRPGEIVTAIRIPDCSGRTGAAFVKLGSRRYLVISIAMVAAVLVLEGDQIAEARIAVGACSAVATRMLKLEADLKGLTEPEVAAMDFDQAAYLSRLAPIGDMRASAEYRLRSVPTLCRRAVLAAFTGAMHDA